MMDGFEDLSDIFTQDSVLLKQAPAAYLQCINTVGTMCFSESLNASRKRFIEWKPNDVTVDSVQDQEWAVVNTVKKRTRTLSDNFPPDHQHRKYLRLSFDDIKSFRVANKGRKLTFYDGKSETLCCFLFQVSDCLNLVGMIKSYIKTEQATRDKHLSIVYDNNNLELQQLDRSFAELNIESDGSLWNMFKNIKENPYEATFDAFSKITNYVYKSNEHGLADAIVQDDLNRSIVEYENTSLQSQGDYEVVATFPTRKDFPRLKPLSEEQWRSQFDSTGKIEDPECIKTIIFRGGVAPSIRQEVWKFLLDYYPWDSSEVERQKMVKQKCDEYFKMKLQWKSMTKTQEDYFSDYRERKSLIEKDVNRTDRTLEFYAGDNNANLQMLNDILMTYIMYNFDLGYVQGMSDLLAPILLLFKNEVDSFWCFVGFMNKVVSNFHIDQAGMKEQLANLHLLLSFVDPRLANYLDNHDSGNMFFCFRWLLVWFKRELSEEDIMRVWEVLWTGLPCENFHLLVCVAILENERNILIENNYGFTEILKHINDLSGKLDMAFMLNRAVGIFYQIKEADHLTDNIRCILGLRLVGSSSLTIGSHEQSPFESPESSSNGEQPKCSVENVRISPDEETYERSLSSAYL